MASALDVAHLAALNKLALSARGPEKMMIQAKATMLQAKLQPKTAAHPLQSYVGNYDDRIVTVAEGALFGQRTGGPRTRLIPLGGDTFIMESDPTTTVEYSFVGEQPAAMVVIRVDGSRASHPRSN
jgi:hypothetical protein